MAKRDRTGGRPMEFYQEKIKDLSVGDTVIIPKQLTWDKKRRKGSIEMITENIIIVRFKLKITYIKECFLVRDIEKIQRWTK